MRTIRPFHLLIALVAATLALLSACSRDTKTPDGYTPPPECAQDGTCDAGQGGSGLDGSMAGQGGGGMGGSDAMGGSGGEDGGAGAGGGGMGGTGGSDACDPACTDPEPICDEATASCVQCTGDAHCEGHQVGPVCVEGECTECAEAQDCIDQSAGAACVENECVQCTDDTHCTDPAASRCDTDTNECVPCQTNPQCAGITEGDTELALCAAGTCVECTRNNTSACGRNAQDHPYVCDVQQGRCSGEHTVGSAGVCDPCVSDAQCKDGQLCVKQTFTENQTDETTDIGYFCLWQKQAGSAEMPVEDDRNAPKGDCLNIPPYAANRADVESIGGTVGTVCGLRESTSTCIGVDHFSNPDIECAPDAEPDDALCGHPEVEDAYCEQPSGSSTYRCTMRCRGSDDCFDTISCVSNTYCTLE